MNMLLNSLKKLKIFCRPSLKIGLINQNYEKISSSSILFKFHPSIDDEDENYKYLEIYKSKRKKYSAEVLSIAKLQPRLDWNLFKNFYTLLKKQLLFYDQRYIDERVETVGFNLAAAHFIVHRGGKVRFKGKDEWVQKNEDDEYSLPNHYYPEYIIEELDASTLPIVYDGMLNIENLNELVSLNLSKCPNLNDWCLDRLSDLKYMKLKHLDISYCPLLTENGLTSLARIRTLKRINVEGLTQIKNLKLVCLMLEDCIPELRIEGISYSEDTIPEQTDNNLSQSLIQNKV